jgi:hypothetical protein
MILNRAANVKPVSAAYENHEDTFAAVVGIEVTGKDYKEELKYLELHDKAEDANDSLEVARFALQAVNEVHLMMPGRNDRGAAIHIYAESLAGFLPKKKSGSCTTNFAKTPICRQHSP